MNKHLRLLLASFLVYPSLIWASFSFNPLGTHALALSYAGSAVAKDIFSAVNNPAWAPHVAAGIATSFRNYYGLPSLADIAVGTVFKVGQWPLVISAERKGFNLYAESSLSIGSGYVFDKNISIGISLPIYALHIKNYGDATAVGVKLAINYRPFDNLQIAAIGGNLNTPVLGRSHEKIPGFGILAFAYQPRSDFTLIVDVYKEDLMPFEYRFGVAFKILPTLQLFAGYREEVNSFSTGLDIEIFAYHLGYAIELHPQLGVSHTIGLSYAF